MSPEPKETKELPKRTSDEMLLAHETAISDLIRAVAFMSRRIDLMEEKITDIVYNEELP